MLSWLGKRLIAHNMARASEGEIGPLLRMDAKDIRFPGDNSWGGVIDGKGTLETWLRRFAAVGIRIWPDEVVLKGLPWKQTIYIRSRALDRYLASRGDPLSQRAIGSDS